MISTNPFQPDRVQLPANKERTQGPLTVLLCKLPDAIRQQIEVVESGCWLWTGTQFTTGYGLINCHCAECDPRGGYTHWRACIDGESAEPEGELQ